MQKSKAVEPANDAGEGQTYRRVKTWVESPAMQDVLQRALPTGLDSNTWGLAALAYIRTARDVGKCSPLSVMGAVITVASLGIRLDGIMGHAYLTARPVKDRRGNVTGYEAQVQLGYKGMVVLIYRNHEVQEIEPLIIYQNDNIDFQKGSKAFINHRWSLNEPRGEMRAVYAGLRFRNGFYSFQVYNIDDIMELRRSILLQKYIRVEETPDGPIYWKKPYNKDWYKMSDYEAGQNPWIGHIIPMIHKTAIRWSQKFWPTVGSDFNRAATLVELDDANVSQGMEGLAAEHMPAELRAQAETSETLPKGPQRATIKSRLRGDQLTNQMLAEATARGSQGEQDGGHTANESRSVRQGGVQGGGDDVAQVGSPMTEEEITHALARDQLEHEEWRREQDQKKGD